MDNAFFKKMIALFFNNKDEVSRPIKIVTLQEWPADSFVGSYSNGRTQPEPSPETGPDAVYAFENNRSAEGTFRISTLGERSLLLLLENIGMEKAEDGPGKQLENIQLIAGNHIVRFHPQPYGGYYLYDIIENMPVISLQPEQRTAASSQYNRFCVLMKEPEKFAVFENLALSFQFKLFLEYGIDENSYEIEKTVDINLENIDYSRPLCMLSLREELMGHARTEANRLKYQSLRAVTLSSIEFTTKLPPRVAYALRSSGKNPRDFFDFFIIPAEEEEVIDLEKSYAISRHVPVIIELTQNKTGIETFKVPFCTKLMGRQRLTEAGVLALKPGRYRYIAVLSKEFGMLAQTELYLRLCALSAGLKIDGVEDEELKKRIVLLAHDNDGQSVASVNDSQGLFSADTQALPGFSIESEDSDNRLIFDFINKASGRVPVIEWFNLDADERLQWLPFMEGDNLAIFGISLDGLLNKMAKIPMNTAYKDFFKESYYHLLGLIVTGLVRNEPSMCRKQDNDNIYPWQVRQTLAVICHNLPLLLTIDPVKWDNLTTSFSAALLFSPLRAFAEKYRENNFNVTNIFDSSSEFRSGILFDFRMLCSTLALSITGYEIILEDRHADVISQQLEALQKQMTAGQQTSDNLTRIFDRLRQHCSHSPVRLRESVLGGLDLFLVPEHTEKQPEPLSFSLQALAPEPQLTVKGLSYYNLYKIPHAHILADSMHHYCKVSLLNFDRRAVSSYCFTVTCYFASDRYLAPGKIDLPVDLLDGDEKTLSSPLNVEAFIEEADAALSFLGSENPESSEFFKEKRSYRLKATLSGQQGKKRPDKFLECVFIKLFFVFKGAPVEIISAAAEVYYNYFKEPVERSPFLYAPLLKEIAEDKRKLENKFAYYKAFPLTFFGMSHENALLYLKIYTEKELFASGIRIFISFFDSGRKLVESIELTAAHMRYLSNEKAFYKLLRLDILNGRSVSELVFTCFTENMHNPLLKQLGVAAAFIGYKCPLNYIVNKPGVHSYITAAHRTNTLMIRETIGQTVVKCRPGVVNIIVHKYSGVDISVEDKTQEEGLITLHCTAAALATLELIRKDDNLLVAWRYDEKASKERGYLPKEKPFVNPSRSGWQSRALFQGYFSEKHRGWPSFDLKLVIDGFSYMIDVGAGGLKLRRYIRLKNGRQSDLSWYDDGNYITAEEGEALQPSPLGSDILAGLHDSNVFINSRCGADVQMIAHGQKSVFNFLYPGSSMVISSSIYNVMTFYRREGFKAVCLMPDTVERNDFWFMSGTLDNFYTEGDHLFFAEESDLKQVYKKTEKRPPASLAAGDLAFLLEVTGTNAFTKSEPLVTACNDAGQKLFAVILEPLGSDICLSLEVYTEETPQRPVMLYKLQTEGRPGHFYLAFAFTRENDDWLYDMTFFSDVKEREMPLKGDGSAISFSRFAAPKTLTFHKAVDSCYSGFYPISSDDEADNHTNLTAAAFSGGSHIVLLQNALLLPPALQFNTHIFIDGVRISLYEVIELLSRRPQATPDAGFYKFADKNEPRYQRFLKGLLNRSTNNPFVFYDYLSSDLIQGEF
jgi:hypothetical protein